MGKKLRVLIVEDSEDDALLVVRELKRGGYEPIFERVDTAEAVREALADKTWDIVISDYVMPQFSGLEALKLLQKSGIDLPFIIVSGKIGEETAVDAMRAGAQDYIMKDNLAKLVPAVERELREAQVRRERKQAEEALRRAYAELEMRIQERTAELARTNETLQAIMNNATTIIYVKDSQGRYIMINRQYETLFHIKNEQIKDKTDYDIFPKEITDTLRSNDQKVLQARTSLEFDEIIAQEDGLHTYISIKFPLYDLAGIPYAVGCISTDITERKRIEEELRRSNAELEQFTYIAAHDLQEPLHMISIFTQFLERRYKGQLDKDADEFIGYIVDCAKHMQQMIEDLQAYSSISTRSKPFKPTDFEAIFEQAVANLKADIEENGVKITHDPLPAVMADDSQMVQLLQHLISNAIKFRGEEPPHIHISAQIKGNEWIFSVRDNGIGISPEFMRWLFKIFQREHVTKYPGTGVGLAICRRIVERHGGRIWAESEVGKGSTFYFTIPVRKDKF